MSRAKGFTTHRQRVMKNGSYGATLMVDLYYPPSLHDAHNCYPLAVEKKRVPQTTQWQQQQRDKLGIKETKVEKLIPDVGDKDKMKLNYVLWY